MATIKNELSISGPSSPFYIVVCYKTTAPSIELARAVYTNGVSLNPFKFTFNNLPNGTYIVKVHASSDGTTLGVLRHDYWIDAVTGFTDRSALYFVVNSGIDYAPADQSTQYANPTLLGKSVNWVFQEGFRFLKKGVEWQELAGGGFELLGGLKFDDNLTYFYELEEIVMVASPSPDDAFSEILQFSTDITLNSTHYNKTILCASLASSQTVTVANAGVPDGKGFIIAHDGGSAIMLYLVGATFRFRGQDVSEIYIGYGEFIKIIRKGSKWIVTDYKGQWDRVGNRVSVDVVGKNMLIADGVTIYHGGTFKRIWDFITNVLPVSQRVSFTDYNATTVVNGVTVYPNRGFWGVDIPHFLFRTPDMRGQAVKNLTGVTPSDIPGRYTHWQVGEHEHIGLTAENTSHGASSSTQFVPNVKLLVNTTAGNVTSISQAKTGKHNIGGETVVKGYELIPVVLI